MSSLVANPRIDQDLSLADVTLTLGSDNSINIRIETERLVLTPAVQADLEMLHSRLYGDKEVMAKYLEGKELPIDSVQRRLDTWQKRIETGNPFIGLIARTKEGELVGIVVAGEGDDPGISAMAYLVVKEMWNQGYGTEMGMAAGAHLVPILRSYEHKIEGVTVGAIEATARLDNMPSAYILESIGLQKNGEPKEIHEGIRQSYLGQVPDPASGSVWQMECFADRLEIREKSVVLRNRIERDPTA